MRLKNKYIYQKQNFYNLIGFKNIKCSIADNLHLTKNYLEKKGHIVCTYDISCLKNLVHLKNVIFCIQPFELFRHRNILKKFNHKPSVLWVWEFKYLPSIFKELESYFDKIYTPSEFCKRVFENYLSTPIEKIGITSRIHEVIDQIANHQIQNKNVLNILDKIKGKITYGYCFDLNSCIFRKNPGNLVRAFSQIKDNNKSLILKFRMPRGKFYNKFEENEFNNMIDIIKKSNSIYVINDELSNLDLYKLYTYFDYYISPHCGEGYGITIYDNMILGNKIISPYYSGETEYLKKGKFIELEYQEKEIEELKYHGVYRLMEKPIGCYIQVEEILEKIFFI